MNRRVQIISKTGSTVTGTSRYTDQLLHGLLQAGTDAFCSAPHIPEWIKRASKRVRIDATTFFNSYPIRVQSAQADIVHITTQTMATLLHLQRFTAPVVVTVLDIIPYLLRNDPRLRTFGHKVDEYFYRFALAGLRRADGLIAISEYTKQTLAEYLDLNPDKIYVTHLGVDQKRFRPLDVPETFYQRYGLHIEKPHVLYVGSEDPRKNLETLIQAFALAKQHIPDLILLKVGPAHFSQERNRLEALIDKLAIGDSVRFFDHVPDTDLPLFYNASDVYVMPSLYEGFGLPVLEAMACGTPVICSNSTSLVEIGADVCTLVEPLDVTGFAEAIQVVLTRQPEQSIIDHAGKFSWEKTIRLTQQAYLKVLDNPH